MAFGGTNFGVTAGSDGNNGVYEFLPMITSYDYDAPINQQGRATEKYLAIRSLIQNNNKNHKKMLNIPQPIPSMTVDAFTPEIQGYLWSNLPNATLKNASLTYF